MPKQPRCGQKHLADLERSEQMCLVICDLISPTFYFLAKPLRSQYYYPIDMLQNSVQTKRKAAQMTQEDLAKAVGVTRQTIISIEKGNYVPSVLLAMKIAQCFKVEVEDVFYLES